MHGLSYELRDSMWEFIFRSFKICVLPTFLSPYLYLSSLYAQECVCFFGNREIPIFIFSRKREKIDMQTTTTTTAHFFYFIYLFICFLQYDFSFEYIYSLDMCDQ